jgi:hypothetical protein
MKAAFIIEICILLSCPVFSQHNHVVKGRVIGFPLARSFSMGLGFERMIGDRFSAQLLYNRFGFDSSDTDGSAEQTNAIVPEARFYFGKHRKETINKASFLGLFAECSRTRTEPGIEGSEQGVVYLNGWRKLFAPGLVLGRNVRVSERFYLEFYTGPKYRFWSKTTKRLVFQVLETETEHFRKLGLRGGFNLGFRFG